MLYCKLHFYDGISAYVFCIMDIIVGNKSCIDTPVGGKKTIFFLAKNCVWTSIMATQYLLGEYVTSMQPYNSLYEWVIESFIHQINSKILVNSWKSL